MDDNGLIDRDGKVERLMNNIHIKEFYNEIYISYYKIKKQHVTNFEFKWGLRGFLADFMYDNYHDILEYVDVEMIAKKYKFIIEMYFIDIGDDDDYWTTLTSFIYHLDCVFHIEKIPYLQRLDKIKNLMDNAQ